MINKSKVAYLPNLDSLRGFAAFLVMILHFSSYLTPAVGDVFLQFTPFVVKSYLWVDLFFILSGVVLTHSYRESFTSGFAKNIYLNFIKKRFVRIYPLHLLTLFSLVLLHWGLVSLINVGDDPMNILRNKTTLVTNVFLLHSTGLGDFGCYNCTSWNYPSWSISVEWVCYLFFPILFYLCLKLKKIMVLFIPVFYYLLFYFVEKDIGHLDVASSFGLMRGFIGFTWGILIYLTAYKKWESPAWLSYAIFISIILSIHFSILPDSFTAYFMGFLILVLLNLKAKTHFENIVLKWLGKVSYSIYLIHVLVQDYFNYFLRLIMSKNAQDFGLNGQIVIFLFSITTVLILSHFSYAKVEKFFIKKYRPKNA